MATSIIKNSLARTLNWVVFNNTSTLTSQVDALPVGTYDGYIQSYGAMSATGMPTNSNFYLHIYVSSNANYKEILAYPISGSSGECYSCIRKGASWETEWVKMPTRAEVDLYAQAKSIFGSGTINDADDAPVRSVYIAYTTAAHVPQQGILYTWGDTSYRVQLLVCGNCMYTRAKIGSGSWSSWYKYNGTAQ